MDMKLTTTAARDAFIKNHKIVLESNFYSNMSLALCVGGSASLFSIIFSLASDGDKPRFTFNSLIENESPSSTLLYLVFPLLIFFAGACQYRGRKLLDRLVLPEHDSYPKPDSQVSCRVCGTTPPPHN